MLNQAAKATQAWCLLKIVSNYNVSHFNCLFFTELVSQTIDDDKQFAWKSCGHLFGQKTESIASLIFTLIFVTKNKYLQNAAKIILTTKQLFWMRCLFWKTFLKKRNFCQSCTLNETSSTKTVQKFYFAAALTRRAGTKNANFGN